MTISIFPERWRFLEAPGSDTQYLTAGEQESADKMWVGLGTGGRTARGGEGHSAVTTGSTRGWLLSWKTYGKVVGNQQLGSINSLISGENYCHLKRKFSKTLKDRSPNVFHSILLISNASWLWDFVKCQHRFQVMACYHQVTKHYLNQCCVTIQGPFGRV